MEQTKRSTWKSVSFSVRAINSIQYSAAGLCLALIFSLAPKDSFANSNANSNANYGTYYAIHFQGVVLHANNSVLGLGEVDFNYPSQYLPDNTTCLAFWGEPYFNYSANLWWGNGGCMNDPNVFQATVGVVWGNVWEVTYTGYW